MENRYGGFQFELTLPKGVSVTKVEKADRLLAINGYLTYWGKSNEESNTFTILGFNMNRRNIEGMDGAVVYVTLAADANMETGKVFQSMMNEPTITTVDLLEVTSAPQTFNITIGDANVINGISTATCAATSSVEGEVYDIQGSHVSKDISHLRKGVYIVNGKKTVNK